MALQDFPELKAIFDKLMAEKEQIMAKAAPLRAERDHIRQQMAPFEVRERELIQQYRAIEQPRLGEIDTQLAAIARSTGGLVLETTPTADGTGPA
jgi:chromosome segregation ATPase